MIYTLYHSRTFFLTKVYLNNKEMILNSVHLVFISIMYFKFSQSLYKITFHTNDTSVCTSESEDRLISHFVVFPRN